MFLSLHFLHPKHSKSNLPQIDQKLQISKKMAASFSKLFMKTGNFDHIQEAHTLLAAQHDNHSPMSRPAEDYLFTIVLFKSQHLMRSEFSSLN